MDAIWQVQEAKNRFSEVIDRALADGPQLVTRHGRPVVRVVAVDPANEGARAAPSGGGFARYLLDAPRLGAFEAPVRRGRKAAPVLGD
jgi:antitoxin Phd